MLVLFSTPAAYELLLHKCLFATWHRVTTVSYLLMLMPPFFFLACSLRFNVLAQNLSWGNQTDASVFHSWQILFYFFSSSKPWIFKFLIFLCSGVISLRDMSSRLEDRSPTPSNDDMDNRSDCSDSMFNRGVRSSSENHLGATYQDETGNRVCYYFKQFALSQDFPLHPDLSLDCSMMPLEMTMKTPLWILELK